MTESGPDPSTAGYPGHRPRSRRPLHAEAADRLRDMIVEGELAPGERIREQAVCDLLGLSRTPLREAMKVLAAEGLVMLQPNRGATVSDPSPADIADTFRVIGALEALAGELACERVKENEIAEIRVLHYQMALHQTRGELREYFRLNQRIHETLVELSGNNVLIETHRQLGGRIRRQRFVANRSGDRWEQAMEEHEQMLEALAARDGKRLAEVLRRHLDNKLTALERVDRDAGVRLEVLAD
ncbi:MAG: GntR family transcriptional regulator [Alphaproteobacteria bacterium]|nr:GntR family transcriptional regulator [Alphaproteobacteria bacterium]